mgnify:FL=1|jgi:CxxC motif-containing protein (DUF1111 family)|tara:strand:- start:2725 stop:4197 length:1473 start_codon:yes stop_codon:yes gene_type:complete
MNKSIVIALLVGFIFNLLGVQAFALVYPVSKSFKQAELGEELPGGQSTVNKKLNSHSFSQSSANMKFLRKLDFSLGNAMFRKLWIASPSSTLASDGLGPMFNAPSCQRCHLKDGRGHPPNANFPHDNAISMVMRLSIPPQNTVQSAALMNGRLGVIPEPTYGIQLQDLAITGLKSEGKIHIEYDEMIVDLAGGEQVSLRNPTYRISHANYGGQHPEMMMSVRVAPPMIGLGLLEAIPAADILSLADTEDRNKDGISGKANQVWDVSKKRSVLGRFGWKAGQPNLNQQNSDAFSNDMGLASRMFRHLSGDCTEVQVGCIKAPHGGSPQHNNLEVGHEAMELVNFYSRNLAVPKRIKANSAAVLMGKKLFYQSGCTGCHYPSYITSKKAAVEQAEQHIWPYTDLLLHDMGEGLADHRPEFKATGFEWRTPPLWGIGLTQVVNKHSFFLHDGRARNLLEAIIWHGGEALKAQQKVVNMTPEERYLLISFVESL